MTFIPHKVSREASETRKAKRKFTTPDVPDTNLAWSTTGKRPEKGQPPTALAQALERAKARDSKPVGTETRVTAADAIRRIANGR